MSWSVLHWMNQRWSRSIGEVEGVVFEVCSGRVIPCGQVVV